jgi:thiamine pyrophosphate-dependent acetolactate synthase large subunit-like protein
MTMPNATLNRRAVTAQLLRKRGNALVVTGLGSTTYDACATGDHPLTFPLLGAMGSAVMIGLGLAKARPDRRVLVITGDGEMLMGLGSLATAGVARPKNLAVVVIDNGLYAETGMQRAHTGHGVDLATIAKGACFAAAEVVWTQTELDTLEERLYVAAGPTFANIKVTAEPTPIALPPSLDGTYLRTRFRDALLGPGAPD